MVYSSAWLPLSVPLCRLQTVVEVWLLRLNISPKIQIGRAPESIPVYSASKQINSSCVFLIETLFFRDFPYSISEKSWEQISGRPQQSKPKPLWHRLNNHSFPLLYFLSKRCPCFTFWSVSGWCVLVVVCFEVSLVCVTLIWNAWQCFTTMVWFDLNFVLFEEWYLHPPSSLSLSLDYSLSVFVLAPFITSPLLLMFS